MAILHSLVSFRVFLSHAYSRGVSLKQGGALLKGIAKQWAARCARPRIN